MPSRPPSSAARAGCCRSRTFFFGAFDEKLNHNVFHFDHRPEIAAGVQDKINSDVFKGQDPTPLRTFAAYLHAVHYARSQPSPTQQSALSSAQQLVRNARRSIIEPVLASFNLSFDSSTDGEQQLAPDPAREKEQLRRTRLRNKGGLTLRASGIHAKIRSETEKCTPPMLTSSSDCSLRSPTVKRIGGLRYRRQ
ncbi:hypothetical protein V8E53_002993 [Lactarius tabidus]